MDVKLNIGMHDSKLAIIQSMYRNSAYACMKPNASIWKDPVFATMLLQYATEGCPVKRRT